AEPAPRPAPASRPAAPPQRAVRHTDHADQPDWDDAPPPDFAPAMADEPDPAPDRPHLGSRARRPGLGLVERLVLLLLSHPQVVRDRPLPEGVEGLDLARVDLLLQVAGAVREHATPAAALGAIMALEQGESLSRLLREALKPTMDDDTARRYWDDAL